MRCSKGRIRKVGNKKRVPHTHELSVPLLKWKMKKKPVAEPLGSNAGPRKGIGPHNPFGSPPPRCTHRCYDQSRTKKKMCGALIKKARYTVARGGAKSAEKVRISPQKNFSRLVKVEHCRYCMYCTVGTVYLCTWYRYPVHRYTDTVSKPTW